MADNCIDVYYKLDRYYLTGNSIDFALNYKDLGGDVTEMTIHNDLNPFPRLHKPYNVCFLSHRIHKNKYRLRVRVLMCRLKQEIRSDFLSEAISNVRARFLRSFRKSEGNDYDDTDNLQARSGQDIP